MPACQSTRSGFSDYLDGRLTGVAMQAMAAHMEGCPGCAGEFAEWRRMQNLLGSLRPLAAPADLNLRLRVAISREKARSTAAWLDRLRLGWQNTLAPLVLQAGMGLASTILLLGSVCLMVGMFAQPENLSASDEPLGMATAPHFLYSSSGEADAIATAHGNPSVVEAYIDPSGRVYDYRILAGPEDSGTRARLTDVLLFSRFEPARVFGQPVRGRAVMSFAGLEIHS